MSLHQAISLDFKPVQKLTTEADFTYSITPTTISITAGKGSRSVTNDIEAVLRKIEYRHQGTIAAFKIMYRGESGIWYSVRWDGQHPSFFAIEETDEGKAREKVRGMELEQGNLIKRRVCWGQQRCQQRLSSEHHALQKRR